MSRPAAEPGRRSIAVDAPRAFDLRLLSHEFAVSLPDPAVADTLRYLTQRATQHGSPAHRVVVDVRAADGGYDVFEDGDFVGDAADPVGVLGIVYERVHQHVFDAASREGWVRIHAALVEVGGQRVLMSGPAGVGKTTLTLELLYRGASVHGDESVLLRDGVSVAVPRPLHLKAGVEEQVPEIEPLLASLPRVEADETVWAFDPTVAGFDWEITPGPVDVVVVLEQADDTTLEPVKPTEVMQRVVEEVFLLHEPKSTVVREVSTIFRRARCYRLRLGSARQASDLLHTLVG